MNGIEHEIGKLTAEVSALREEVRQLRTKQAEMNDQINRWKGGLPVLVAVGGFIGWMGANFDKVLSWFRS